MNKDKDIPMYAIWGIIIGIIFVWFTSAILIYRNLDSWTERGTFGDMFGAINALFSGFAFAGVIVAIMLQKKELKLQREELEETRKELARSADAHESSVKLSAKYHEENLKHSIDAHTQNTKIDTLNTMLSAYTTILDPTRGIKNRNIEHYDLNEENIKKKFLRTLEELEKHIIGE